MNNQQRINSIRECLMSALQPSELQIDDESHKHIGHAGAKDGRGHFAVTIRSNQFTGLSSIQRHRMIYAALGDMMTTDIHALRITALTEEE